MKVFRQIFPFVNICTDKLRLYLFFYLLFLLQYRLETFTESRSTEWSHEPYHGMFLPLMSSKKEYANSDSWAYNLQHQPLSTNTNTKMSQRIRLKCFFQPCLVKHKFLLEYIFFFSYKYLRVQFVH